MQETTATTTAGCACSTSKKRRGNLGILGIADVIRLGRTRTDALSSNVNVNPQDEHKPGREGSKENRKKENLGIVVAGVLSALIMIDLVLLELFLTARQTMYITGDRSNAHKLRMRHT